MLLPNLRSARKAGFSLLETTSAVAFVGMFIAVLITVSSNVLNLVRTAKDNISASQVVHQRLEQMRLAKWVAATDAQSVADDILADESPSVAGLSAPTETIVISPYPPKASFVPGKIVRKNGVSTVVSANPALQLERLVRVDVTLTWSGFPNKRNRERAATVLIARGGPTQ